MKRNPQKRRAVVSPGHWASECLRFVQSSQQVRRAKGGKRCGVAGVDPSHLAPDSASLQKNSLLGN